MLISCLLLEIFSSWLLSQPKLCAVLCTLLSSCQAFSLQSHFEFLQSITSFWTHPWIVSDLWTAWWGLVLFVRFCFNICLCPCNALNLSVNCGRFSSVGASRPLIYLPSLCCADAGRRYGDPDWQSLPNPSGRTCLIGEQISGTDWKWGIKQFVSVFVCCLSGFYWWHCGALKIRRHFTMIQGCTVFDVLKYEPFS